MNQESFFLSTGCTVTPMTEFSSDKNGPTSSREEKESVYGVIRFNF